jgi:hypothetical protein
MGLTAHPIPCGPDEEVEVRARVGLLYVVNIEPLPAPYGIGEACEGGGVGSATQQLLLRHLQHQDSAGHVEGDLVAGLHQCQRPAGRGLGRDMQHNGSVGSAAIRPAHMPTMSRTPCVSGFFGSGMLETSGIPGQPLGPQPRSTSTVFASPAIRTTTGSA